MKTTCIGILAGIYLVGKGIFVVFPVQRVTWLIASNETMLPCGETEVSNAETKIFSLHSVARFF